MPPIPPRVEHSPHKWTLIAKAYCEGLNPKAVAIKFI